MARALRGAWSLLARYYSVLLILLAWEALARSGLVNPRLFPTLGSIGAELWSMVQEQTSFPHVAATLFRVLAGFGLGAVVGVLLGFLMGQFPLFRTVFEPLFSFGYPIPRIALYPIFVFVFGLGHTAKIALIFLECLYPITIHTYYGTRAIPRMYVWSGRNMGASPAQLFRKVVLPATAPHIFAGLRIALPIALVIAIITEMVAATEGLGWLIAFAQASFSRTQIFADVAIVAVIGFLLDRLLGAVRNRLVFWEQGSSLQL